MNHQSVARSVGLSGAVSLLLFFATPPCQAGLLNIQLAPSPIETGLDGSLSYNATTGQFHSTTVPIVLTDPRLPGGAGSFIGATDQTTIDLFVDHNGNFLRSGGGFKIRGDVDLDNDGTADASGVLLEGTITAFGAQDAGPPTRVFDGLFTIEGGALTRPTPLSGGGTAPAEFRVGSTGGFFLFAENVASGTLGDFTHNFSTPDLSVKDTVGVAVPEPATWVLVLVGSGALAARGCFRRATVRLG
jgi:hypothetical protein